MNANAPSKKLLRCALAAVLAFGLTLPAVGLAAFGDEPDASTPPRQLI